MKIEFDFWSTPEGHSVPAQRIKGSVEIPDGPILAVLAAILAASDAQVTGSVISTSLGQAEELLQEASGG